jgi:cellulase
MSTYVAPGPTVYSGGSTKSAGAACSGCESTCTPGSGPVGTATSVPQSTKTTTTGGQPTSSAPSGGGGSCSVAKYGQCGGTGYTGCTTCASGSTCSAVSPPYYSQCV